MKTRLFLFTILLIVISISFSIAQTAYIPSVNNNCVTLIDIATNNVAGNIAVGNFPYGVSPSPDGSKVYVTNNGDNTVSVINTATNSVSATIPVGYNSFGISVSPDGSKVYVASNNSDTVSVINTATNSVIATIRVGSGPYALCVSPDGSQLYVSNEFDNTVSVICTAICADTAVIPIPVGFSPHEITVSPDGSRVYVVNSNDNTVSVINTAIDTVIATVAVSIAPMGLSVSPDGSKVYVVNNIDNTISIINSTTDSVITTIGTGFDRPQAISFSPDGSKAYVVNNDDNTISVINTTTNIVTSTVAIGSDPTALGNFISIYHTNCFAHYTTTYDSTLNTFILTVDSMSSASALSYHWNFGDGTSSSLAIPPPHTYTRDSLYNVCMKTYTASGDSCEYCHIIGKDSLGNIIRTTGFTLIVQNTPTVNVPEIMKEINITISPNPFTSQTTISFSQEQTNTKIKITDILGKEIKSINFTGTQCTLEKGTMQAGIYFVQITTTSAGSVNTAGSVNENIVNRKVVVQ